MTDLSPHPALRSDLRPGLVLATCCLSLLLVMMDVTIVNVALPSIRAALGGRFSTLQWVVDAYTLVVATLLVLAGSTADRIGRRRVFVTGIAIFCLGSALCGLAPSARALVMARAFQGLGGAMLNPVALSIIANVFVTPVARARAIGMWGGMSGLALALGPLAGGVLTTLAGWRAVFWVNLPIGLVAMVLSLRFIPESRAARVRPIDVPAQVLIALVLAATTAALIEARNYGWGAPAIQATLALAAMGMVALVVVERRRAQPLLDLRFFRALPFTGAILIAICAFAIFSSFLFLNTLYLQDVRGLSALRAGLYTLPFAMGVMACAPLSGRIVGAHGARLPLLLSALGLGGGAILLTGLTATTPPAVLLAAYGLCGCGFGLCNAPITNAAVSGMPRDQAGLAAALASTSRQIGALLGIAASGAMTASVMSAPVQPAPLSSAGAVVAYMALLPAASHRVWWTIVVLACGIAGLGVVSTGARARRSAQTVRALFDDGPQASGYRTDSTPPST
ncbi:drug resistance transporter, EmrB/QacA subfamily [Gluconacetobacter diazotrophicus PA1 5]|uniref:MFS transporter n=1 Tax=Gluconacetobacter diazotrophicus TaxID=33996 RepID=A0A7W4NFX6_GLUDI|nr:MFS transporter [Gluconacetobacter diazotrophicus]ACI51101.1 drug resistance transporter, EmrB/QacA subfamily [Gluconacetobacter diazotrophicus PA1 5]MBB2157017.1 MFS transporter [Gluconacetobacter diazotrophicus]TWB07624.1 EmrB/QacA subfamily drug resistance transporter [Gluconacetobacter diazotrophicus]